MDAIILFYFFSDNFFINLYFQDSDDLWADDDSFSDEDSWETESEKSVLGNEEEYVLFFPSCTKK